MKINRIDHIGIAMKELEGLRSLLELLFPGTDPHVEDVADQGVRATCYPAGKSSLEFLESTREGSAVGRFLEKKGGGIHHIALNVDDLEGALKELKKAGIPLVDEKPRNGAEGKRIAFLHPKGTGGILIELCEG